MHFAFSAGPLLSARTAKRRSTALETKVSRLPLEKQVLVVEEEEEEEKEKVLEEVSSVPTGARQGEVVL